MGKAAGNHWACLSHALVAVAGGMIAVGGGAAATLFDEDSGRWMKLPHHPMAAPRDQFISVVSVPV